MSDKPVNTGEKSLSTEASNPDNWADQTVTSNDVIIPKILPQQYMSQAVIDRESEYGEFRDTMFLEKFGDIENPFEFIPFYMSKKWIIFDMVPTKGGGNKREFREIVLIDDDPRSSGYNDDLSLSGKDSEGYPIERDRCMDFYVLIPSQVESGESFPYILSFRRTSLKAGKKLASQMFLRNKRASKPPAATVCTLHATSTSNDEGTYIVQDVRPSRPSTEEELNEAYYWLQTVKQGQTKEDTSEFENKEDEKELEVEKF